MTQLDGARRNALRSAARRCSDELHAAIADNPKAPFDTLSGPIIKKHHTPIAPAYSLALFMWQIGVLNGQFEERCNGLIKSDTLLEI